MSNKNVFVEHTINGLPIILIIIIIILNPDIRFLKQ